MDKARSLVKEILNVPDTHDVLFLQGGASLGFLISAYNLMGVNKTGGYLVTGSWAKSCQRGSLWVILLLLDLQKIKTLITFLKVTRYQIISIIFT